MPYDPPRWARVKYVHGKYVVSDFKRQTKDIGVGDLAYVVGIFKPIRAKDRNVPVVHTGYIASMADGELLLAQDWRVGAREGDNIEMQGYVIQAPTLPRASGSPVFVRRSIETLTPALPKDQIINPGTAVKVPLLRSWLHGSVWLLGLWHGAWDDTGMGVCIPALKIMETLDQPELKAMRQASKESKAKEHVVKPQSSPKEVARAGDDILRAALSTPPLEKPKAKVSKRGPRKVSSK
jgi:hypothetical protein